jgi:hypothetical protein
MVKRRNSRYKAFDWGAPRRVPVEYTAQPAPPMPAARWDRTRKREMWTLSNTTGHFLL